MWNTFFHVILNSKLVIWCFLKVCVKIQIQWAFNICFASPTVTLWSYRTKLNATDNHKCAGTWPQCKFGRTNLKWRIGLETVGALSSKGSTMMVNPLVYVATSVARLATVASGEKSVWSATCKVRRSDDSLSAQNRSGFRSMQTRVAKS